MKSPFKFLDAFELKDRDVFFGRAEETEALYAMVFKTPLLLVYGLSGTGKTSLIQCGLASRFSGPNWYPFFIRRGDNINAAIRKALQPAMPPGEPLRDNLHDNVGLLFRYHLRLAFLIFDQFEELFILGDRDEQLEFARSIRALIDADLPCKVILVMREEFIGQLYHLEREIPTIYDFRLRVEPMGFKKVQEVIAGSFGRFHITLEDPEHNIPRMYDNISAGKSGVQLPYLQVYLDMLWEEDFARTYPEGAPGETPPRPSPEGEGDAAHSTPPSPSGEDRGGVATRGEAPGYPPLRLTSAEITAFGKIEDVLARFLLEQERSLQAAMAKKFPGLPAGAVRKIVNAFVTDEGTKRPLRFERDNERYRLLDGGALANLPAIPPEALDFALEQLQNARLLRERDEALELAHDSLATLIDRERSDEERALNDIRLRLRGALREYQLSVEGLQEYVPNKKLLQDTATKFEALELPTDLLTFYREATALDRQREAAKLEEAERNARAQEAAARAEEEARLRQEAERARRRASGRAVVAVVLALLAFAAASWAWNQRSIANHARQLAISSEQAAQKNARLADSLRQNAVQAQQEAVDSAQVAREQRERAKTSEQIAQQALSQLKVETAEKERLQISAKTEIVESFLNAGSCALAGAAMKDLEALVRKYPGEKDIQRNTEALRQRVNACKK